MRTLKFLLQYCVYVCTCLHRRPGLLCYVAWTSFLSRSTCTQISYVSLLRIAMVCLCLHCALEGA